MSKPMLRLVMATPTCSPQPWLTGLGGPAVPAVGDNLASYMPMHMSGGRPPRQVTSIDHISMSIIWIIGIYSATNILINLRKTVASVNVVENAVGFEVATAQAA
jgi:hypothetical protein